VSAAAHRIEPGFPLAELVAGIGAPVGSVTPAGVTVSGLALDSRAVVPGALFIALPGTRTHGAQHVREALARGAVAVLADAPLDLAVPCIVAADVRAAAGAVADRYFGAPSAALETIGVTGTNGKTSVTHFLAELIPDGAVIGTEGSGFPGRLAPATRTTPDVLAVHGTLATLRAAGARAVALEVSSHALDQQRVSGVRFAWAVYTNLGHDHLDYHGTLDAYGAAKARLFDAPGLRGAAMNVGDTFGARLAGRLAGRYPLLTFGAPGADLAARAEPCATGLALELQGRFGHARIELALLGAFNAANVLAALGVLLLRGESYAAAVRRLRGLTPVPGRMEALRAPGRPLVVVDYAHNPPALEVVLAALRPYLGRGGRLHCVFGCGGERDRAKRPLMGAIAQRLADVVLLTDDNPRGEDPSGIVAEIVSGMGAPPTVCHDRAAAIARAIEAAGPADVVLIAGKGAEAYQEIAGRRAPFSDRAVAAAMLGVAL
jgi:UDP-N-acetylmuramoyl-L-alanyl-D-glutamate--2,6-diaminopimelate ligase